MTARAGVLTVLVGVLALAPVAGFGSDGLFRDPEPQRQAALQRDEAPAREGIVRSRAVAIERSALPPAPESDLQPRRAHRLQLNLFDDATLTARITRVERRARGTAWIGHVEGERLSSVVIVERDGVLAGSIASLEALYRIRSDGSGQVVEEIDRSRLRDDSCSTAAPPHARDAEADLSADVVMAADDGSLVDVLVVYTQAARASAGGTSAMLAEIDLAITETNTGYADSGVVQRLRLVGTAELNYAETKASMNTDLSRLTSTSDGYIDNVHTLRDTYKADLVTLIGADYDPPPTCPTCTICGLAWVPGNGSTGLDSGDAPYAFNVVNLPCATGYYSFGHELGHNMGLNHDRATSSCASGSCGDGAYSYSFGYRDPGGAFRSVLAYNCPGGCSRVLHFSNPNVNEGGQPTGVADTESNSAYNALSLNNARVTMANWRVGGSDPPFGGFDTPAAGATGLAGNVPVTGWSLDDVEVTKVDIWRDPEAGETPAANGKMYIADATFVRGARPDVEAAYPSYPNADRAGWGYMLLTNFLPGSGNGSFTLYAYGHDADGQTTLLGSKAITVDNASSTEPFGTLDTPGQGETISGSGYLVWGWALTPVPATVPTDGSTIWVYVDGVPLGHPAYNLYRADIASLFPGYNNSSGAVGYFTLDTTTLSNGMHEIAWSVTDDGGQTQGIGSRYFWVNN